jgi:uncharacterized protein YfaP (DUF2135 family)
MEDERVISFERGKQLADQLGVEFFETSAKENVNVKVCISFSYDYGKKGIDIHVIRPYYIY